MNRIASIRRYREQVLSAASFMAAIASARLESHSVLRDLASRQDEQLADLLHDFAFRARKLIELADREGLPIRALADRKSIPGSREGAGSPAAEEDHGICLYSLWFVLGRIIHSDGVDVQRAQVQLDGHHHDIAHELPWGFGVRSERDHPDVLHFVFLEFLLEEYLHIDEALERHLRQHELRGAAIASS